MMPRFVLIYSLNPRPAALNLMCKLLYDEVWCLFQLTNDPLREAQASEEIRRCTRMHMFLPLVWSNGLEEGPCNSVEDFGDLPSFQVV